MIVARLIRQLGRYRLRVLVSLSIDDAPEPDLLQGAIVVEGRDQ